MRANLDLAQEPKWLSSGEACEIVFRPRQALDGAARRELSAHLKTCLSIDADIAILENRNRRKKLVVADMDSTIIEEESLDELAAQIGLKEKVAAITDRAMRGEIDFESALVERVKLLRGLPVSKIDNVLRGLKYSPGAKTFIATMKAHGAPAALVSGGFTLFTAFVAQELHFDFHKANSLEFENGRLTGLISTPLVDRNSKRQALLSYCATLGISSDDALAIGDGSNDIDMIVEAGLGIGYRPKPLLVTEADAQIMVATLEAALFYQGFRREEFICMEH